MTVLGEDAVLVTDSAFTPRVQTISATVKEMTDKLTRYVALIHDSFGLKPEQIHTINVLQTDIAGKMAYELNQPSPEK